MVQEQVDFYSRKKVYTKRHKNEDTINDDINYNVNTKLYDDSM